METSDDGEWIKVRIGTTKSSTLRNIYGAVDELYSRRPDANLQSEGDTVDEDSDVRPVGSVGASVDAGALDGEPEGGSGNTGESDSPTEPMGAEVDDGTPLDPGDTPEPSSGTDVEPPATQRVEQASRPGSREYGDSEFHFAPGQHSSGTSFY